MGVNKFCIRGLIPEMSNTSHCSDSSVATRKLGQTGSPATLSQQVPKVGIYNGVHCDQHIDHDITFKMRLKLGQEEITGCVGGYPPGGFNHSNLNLLLKSGANHELSMSLPNLAAALDTELLNERHVRNSLSNIFDGKLDSCSKKSRTELSKCIKTFSNEDFNAACHGPEVVSRSVHSPGMNSEELTIEMNGGNNRLSAVLENIPLLYIPHTKQLVSIVPQGQVSETQTGSPNGAKSPPFSPLHRNHKRLENFQDVAIGIQNGTHDFYQGDLGVSTNGHGHLSPTSSCCSSKTPVPQQCYPVMDTSLNDSQTNLLNCSSEQDGTFTLSQDSDASSTCRSEHTVIHQEDSGFGRERRKDSRTVDFEDEECLSDLSAVNLEPGDVQRNSLQRTNTMGSLSKADASSFSSISSISTATDFSASAASCSDDYLELKNVGDVDESGFMEVNLHSRNTFERSRNSSQDSGIDEKQCLGAKPKRRGLSSFFARNLFSWKPGKEATEEVEAEAEIVNPASSPTGSGSGAGWRLFGRVPPKQGSQKDSQIITKEYQAKSKATWQGATRGKRPDVEAPSTTALIQENRPSNLPSKDPVEDLRHRLEYEAMIEAAKKREQREAKLRKKQQLQQLKQEEALAAALKVWNTDILPSWETSKNTKKARDLWWQGIPPAVRGKVWQLAIGNELNLTPELYEICLNRARDRLKLMQDAGDSDSVCSQVSLSFLVSEPSSSKESSVEVIKLDVSRTFPQLCIFQKGGPYYELLQGLLGAYACYRPDVGYVQGMSFIAAVLLLNMEVGEAFSCFANLLNRPCQIAFFRLDESLMKSYFLCYEEFFKENLPRLFTLFQKQALTPDLYIIDWLFTLYAKSLPLDVASRIWDVFCRDGEEFLFRTALAILRLYEDILLSLDFIHLAQFLTKLPENISADSLFRSIDSIIMTIDKKRFSQVLTQFREPKET